MPVTDQRPPIGYPSETGLLPLMPVDTYEVTSFRTTYLEMLT